MKPLLLLLSATLIIITLFASVGSVENPRSSVFRAPDEKTLHLDCEKRSIFGNVIGFLIRLIDIPRQKIKHTNDGQAKLVNSQVQDITIEQLVSLKRPHMI